VKFFTKDNIDPAEVAKRFDLLTEGMSDESATKIIAQLSKEGKGYLAEILSPNYNKAFVALYADFMSIGEKSTNVNKFASSHSFFTDFIAQSVELKSIAEKSGVYDNADATLHKLLTGHGNVAAIKAVTLNFTVVGNVHKSNVSHLEQLLKKIPDDDLHAIEGSSAEAKRQDAVKLISNVIKVNGELVLKVNNQMQAVAMLMTNVVKYRARKVAYIPV
jgi:hypothetical protein